MQANVREGASTAHHDGRAWVMGSQTTHGSRLQVELSIKVKLPLYFKLQW
jgi:hypothetical protein